MLKFFCLISINILLALHVSAQTASVTGKLTCNKNTVEFASISIEGYNISTSSDINGTFTLNVKPGSYTLKITCISYLSTEKQITLKANQKLDLGIIKLKSSTHDLREFTIKAKTETQQARETVIKAEVIDTKQLQQESSSLTEVMSRSSGVKVRVSGGLGSGASLTLNGFSGKAVKFFKDGIPVDYMGNGFDISLLPVNMLDRVEIFKGILPVSLGSDALGGAINLETKTSFSKFIDMSYEFASFNTHRASLNLYTKDKKNKHFIGLDAFYNHSDNNYKTTALVTDYETSTRIPADVTRFHDAFTNGYADLYGGWRNQTWADELKLSITVFGIYKEFQHATLMSDPYGQAAGYQKAIIPSARYKKTFFNDKLSVDQFLVYSRIKSQNIDTSSFKYDWYGNKTKINRIGELDTDGSLSNINFDNYTSRTYISYSINENHKIELNNVLSKYTRTGNDPFGPKFYYTGLDILSAKAEYLKMVTGLGLESKFFNKKITNQIGVKYYFYKTKGTENNYTSYEAGATETKGNTSGIFEAIKYTINEHSFIRAGFEFAYRLPEQAELFGDGQFVVSNFESLKPEKSTNYSLGYRYTNSKISFEPNFFYRVTRDQIQLIPVYLPFSQYLNFEQVKGYGVETDLAYYPKKWIALNGNATYQSIRLFDLKGANSNFLEGSRLRNVPYLFGNLGFRLNFENVIMKRDAIKFIYNYSYTHDFYLVSIPVTNEPSNIFSKASIDTQLIIPTQNFHNAGLVYAFKNDMVSVGFEVKNITDAAIYDNFRVQRAGRSFHIKLRYTIK